MSVSNKDRPSGVPYCVIVVYAAVAAGVFAVMLWGVKPPEAVRFTAEHAKSGLCIVGIVEWLGLAVIVPLWGRTYGTLRSVLFSAGLVLVSLGVSLISPAGRMVAAGSLALHGYLLGFAVLVAGLSVAASNVAGRTWAGQAAALVAALVLIGSVAFVDGVFDRWPSSRDRLTKIVLSTNPVPVCGAILHYDVMRKKNMYNISSIGSYRFAYPEWYWPVLGHLAAGLVLAGIGSIVRRPADEQ